MTHSDHVARQRAFYQAGDHAHLQPQSYDPYAEHIVLQLARGAGLQPDHRVLELGPGFGRFTFPLLDHCAAIVAADLSQRVLDGLAQERDRRGIAPARCRTVCRDVNDLSLDDIGGPVDFVVGFFFLHHLADFRQTIEMLMALLSRRGGMAFVEPNRLNPLYLAQILCCPDMHWHEEKGLYRLSRKIIGGAFREAGLGDVAARTFGFFPPQIVNRWPAACRLERRLEGARALSAVLPFVLVSARDRGGVAGIGDDRRAAAATLFE
jgi:SAM-dependent methyltransferase